LIIALLGIFLLSRCSGVQEAKHSLHIAYQHTSYGSRLITGIELFDQFMGQKGVFTYNNGGLDGALDMHDNAMQSYYPDWAIATRNYLNAVENRDVNVIYGLGVPFMPVKGS
jgi:hypothetical protein